MTNYFCLVCSTAQLLSVSLRRRQTSPLTQMHNYIRVRGSRTWNSFWPRGENLAALCEGCSFPSCFHHPDRRSRRSLAWSVNQMDSIDHLPGNNVFSPLCAAACTQCGYGDILILSKLAMQYYLEFVHNGSHVGVKILFVHIFRSLWKSGMQFTSQNCLVNLQKAAQIILGLTFLLTFLLQLTCLTYQMFESALENGLLIPRPSISSH